ncbi:MAG TPA: hypothetical protein HA282_04100 [Nanoarchaeota archaeon]|uniref:Antitoxin n=1 Tax=Candidatus Amesbacteria bacterium GW2011_GWC2_45_19 TaxID=1618366 RepID=A0A0G1P814_9BACT|nr:MAG: hypothetical protein QT01_C0004G0014 [archaeon GW2011_AR6]KKU01453.1 MAG: hypothetical protein UX05_C0021G0007 [Candidatus Amesbacteria bacterium GW2011_GWC2_45_19]MBS3082626.1 hypothetical protein [Candidatus Pacearchaeota archaeon]HIH17518.1 hypothetical protein [Nanoarchaeota archaeon]HIH33704.1 hypothetical protein [Nanoarchaeota archaeon]
MGDMLTVRNVDEEIYRKFRERALAEKMKIGRALAEAMNLWVEFGRKEVEKDPKNLIRITGIIKTKKKVRWSEEVDEILYGWKK